MKGVASWRPALSLDEIPRQRKESFDYAITLCGDSAKEICPVSIGKAKQTLHWNFIDPAEAVGNDQEVLAVFRKVREEIKTNIEEFVKESKELS